MLAAFTPAYGPASILDVREAPAPSPGPDEILIDVVASTVTMGDQRLRSADFPGALGFIGRLMFGWSAPRTPVQGTMYSGRVAAVGAKVTRFAVGDAVMGMADDGAWAEQVVVKADGPVAHKPESATHAEAAASIYGPETAHHFLRELGQVQPGQHVLVIGGSGGVGRFAIQIAKHMGATVTAVGSAAAADLMRRLGADATIDYRTTDYAETGETYDIVFDVASISTFDRARRVLGATGRYLTLGMTPTVLWQQLWTRITGGPSAHFAIAMPGREQIEAVAQLLADGVIWPVLGQRFPLARIAEAHQAAGDDRNASVVVQVAGPKVLRPAV